MRGVDRYASSVHWSLDRGSDKNLLVRLIAFPTCDLPDWQRSRSVLESLTSFVNRKMPSEVARTRGKGQNVSPARGSPPKRSSQTVHPSVRAPVRARLQQRTKNSWSVETIDGSMKGSIGNPRDLPSELQEGQEVELVVTRASADAAIFRWPTEADKAKTGKSGDAGPTGQRTARRGRRRKP